MVLLLDLVLKVFKLKLSKKWDDKVNLRQNFNLHLKEIIYTKLKLESKVPTNISKKEISLSIRMLHKVRILEKQYKSFNSINSKELISRRMNYTFLL